MWKYYATLSAFFAALTAILSKLGVKDIDADVATAIRAVFILLLVWGILLARQGLPSLTGIPHKVWLFLLLSAVATGLSWLFYFKALETGDVAQVAPLDKLSVPITIIIAVTLLGEPLTWKVAMGGALVALGTLIIAL